MKNNLVNIFEYWRKADGEETKTFSVFSKECQSLIKQIIVLVINLLKRKAI